MGTFKFLIAIALVALTTPVTLAQDDGAKEDRKTESKEADAEKKSDKDDFDRGDAKAEKFFKRAYTRVYSAEAEGLEKLYAKADIKVDLADMGMGELPFPGEMSWQTGGKAVWESTDESEGNNPLGNVSTAAKSVFEPYLAFVTGFKSYDVHFKEASFKFGDPVVEEEKEVAKTVVVTFADEDQPEETYAVADNKVVKLLHATTVQDQEATVTFGFEYEDQGHQLRLQSVSAMTEVAIEGMPKEKRDPKNPVPVGDEKEKLEGKITVTKYGKVGDVEIALELEGELSAMGMAIPTSLVLSEAKINDDVKEEDLPDTDEDEGKEEGDKPVEDEEF